MPEEDDGQRRDRRREEAEEMARLQEQINNLPVSEHVLYMMHSLSSLAVDRLGLVPEGASRKDIQQARLAIDAFRALLGVLEEARPTEEVAAHRSVLAQLQLAYVGALDGAASSEQAPAAEQAEQAPAAEQAEPEPERAAPQAAPAPEPEPAPKAATEPAPKPAPKPKSASKKTAKPGGARKGDGAAGAAKPAPKGGAKGGGKGDSSAAAKGGKKSS